MEVGICSVSNAKDDTWKDVTWYDRKKSSPAEVCEKLDSVSTPGSRIKPSALALQDYSVPGAERRSVKAAESAQPDATATISAFRAYVK